MADISKIKLANGTTVDLKDANGRQDLANLLAALKEAAYVDVCEAITGSAELPTDLAVKNYVDAQIGTINKFDVVVLAAGQDLPTASADTMYKLYLKPETGAVSGSYAEYITVRSGSEGSYTYAWEKIGTTAVDLTNYVQKTTTIAGIDLQDNISVAELQSALGLKALAYAATASGSTTLDTIDSITMNDVTVAGNAAVTHTSTAATVNKTDYTPSGSVTGEAIKDGSIEVTVKDAATATAAALTREAYKPAGSVSGTVSVPSSAAMAKAADGFQIEGTVSKPSITVTPVDATVVGSVTSAGTLPTYTEGAFDGGSLSKGSAVTAATEGIVATLGTGADAETLIFTAAGTDEVMDYNATYTAATYAGATFTQGAMPTFENATVVGSATAALDAAPTFSGEKYAVNLTNADAEIDASFDGTQVENFRVTAVNYYKQEIDQAEFTGVAATLGFSGNTVEDALVTGVLYDKADATAAFSETVTPTTKTLTKTAKAIGITVTPDA